MYAKSTADKHSRVLDAAEGVFLSRGYSRTTMGHLAAAAGMSRPALYLVYPRKHELFSAIVRDEPRCSRGDGDNSGDGHDLRRWMTWVCDLWLGDNVFDDQPSNSVQIHLHQRSECSPREVILLQSILEDGLAKRSPWPVDDGVNISVARLLTFCVCGLLDGRVGAAERKALLAVQVDALAAAVPRPEEPEALFHRPPASTVTIKAPATERATGAR